MDKEITVADYHVTKDKLDRAVELLREVAKTMVHESFFYRV